MGGEICGWENLKSLEMTPYGERFHKCLKRFHRVIGAKERIILRVASG